jgi:hypothetical protein
VNPFAVTLILALPIIALGLFSIVQQTRRKKELAQRAFVPPDEAIYLKTQYRRRLICGISMTIVGLMIAGAYLSGMEAKADAGRSGFQEMPENGEKPPPTPEEKRFFRFWSLYWIVIVSLVGVMIFVASADAWATRKYGIKILRELRDEHKAKLARDLAIYKNQKSTDRFGNRLGGST